MNYVGQPGRQILSTRVDISCWQQWRHHVVALWSPCHRERIPTPMITVCKDFGGGCAEPTSFCLRMACSLVGQSIEM